jgi:hypothetical protein
MKMVGLVDDDRFSLPLTQEDLADATDATGLTAVHTNGILQKLRAERLIELHGGLLNVLDVERLRKVAGFDPSYLHLKRRAPMP